MALTVKQVNYIRDMCIKYKDNKLKKRLRKKLIHKSEYDYLCKYFRQLEKNDKIYNILSM